MAKYSAKQKKEWPHLHRVVTHLRHGAAGRDDGRLASWREEEVTHG